MKAGVACAGNIRPGPGWLRPTTTYTAAWVFSFLLLSFVQFFVLLHGHGLSLALLAEFLHNSDDSAVAKALEN